MVDLVKGEKMGTLDFGGNPTPLVDLNHQNVFLDFPNSLAESNVLVFFYIYQNTIHVFVGTKMHIRSGLIKLSAYRKLKYFVLKFQNCKQCTYL